MVSESDINFDVPTNVFYHIYYLYIHSISGRVDKASATETVDSGSKFSATKILT